MNIIRIIVVVGSLLHPLVAWPFQSRVHTGLIQLSPVMFRVPGVSASFREILINDNEIAAACHRRHGMAWDQRAHYDLVCGTDEPDALRNVFQNRSHQEDALNRAENAYWAAVGQSRQTGPQADARAARRLGHSLHYLGDLADPSKQAGPYKDEVRAYLQRYVDWYLYWFRRTKRPHPDLERALDLHRNDLRNVRNPRHIGEWASWHRLQLSGRMTYILNQLAGHTPRNRMIALHNLLLHAVAVNVAAQERWIDLNNAERETAPRQTRRYPDTPAPPERSQGRLHPPITGDGAGPQNIPGDCNPSVNPACGFDDIMIR